MIKDLSIAFIGGGNMATALAAGMIARGVEPRRIHVIEIDPVRQADWQARGVDVAGLADERLTQSSVWIYAVKPQVMREVVARTRSFLRDSLVISIAAGIRLDAMARWLAQGERSWPRLVRCMPNTPALVGAGISGLAGTPELGQADRDLASELLGSVGQVVWVQDDEALDAVTALSGSGPAYVFLFLQALIEGGVAVGLSAEQARELALGTLAGAIRLAAESTETPEVLRQRVTSPGGTTAAALEVMFQRDLPGIVRDALQRAAQRAAELGRDFSAP